MSLALPRLSLRWCHQRGKSSPQGVPSFRHKFRSITDRKLLLVLFGRYFFHFLKHLLTPYCVLGHLDLDWGLLDACQTVAHHCWSVSCFYLSLTTTVVGAISPTGDSCLFSKQPPTIFEGVPSITGGDYAFLTPLSSVRLFTGSFSVLGRGPCKDFGGMSSIFLVLTTAIVISVLQTRYFFILVGNLPLTSGGISNL